MTDIRPESAVQENNSGLSPILQRLIDEMIGECRERNEF